MNCTMQQRDRRRTHDLASRAGAKAWEGEGKREELRFSGRRKTEQGQRLVLEDNLLAMRTLVVGDVAPDMDPADTVLPVVLILPSACPTTSSCTPRGLQEGWVWASGSLVDQDVQGFLKDPGLREFHLQKASNPQFLPLDAVTQAVPGPRAHPQPLQTQALWPGLSVLLANSLLSKVILALQGPALTSGRATSLFSPLCCQVSWYVLAFDKYRGTAPSQVSFQALGLQQ